MTITPREFVDRWAQSNLKEQQAAQSHFNELCQLVGHKTPTQRDPEGTFFTFEEQVTKATGGKGRADVWYKGHFAWEYKGKHKDLDAAYAQLSAYRGSLGNPPLLVVCDFLEYRIYPQWPNTSGQPFKFYNEDLLNPDTRRYIVWLLENPQKFLELRQTELERREQITLKLAYQFAELADIMERHKDPETGQPAWHPMQIARFLTKLVFSLFAEDVEIMPTPYNQPIFRYLTDGAKETPKAFVRELKLLFEGMNGEIDDFHMKLVPYFNGNLFAESAPGAEDGLEVLDLTQVPGAIDLLARASGSDWREVNPTIFGSLFEGALDKAKRAQLGAHYTSEADIRLVIEPVIMEPLNTLWETVRAEAEPLMQTFLDPASSPRKRNAVRQHLTQIHDDFMDRLESTRVLDPACGSGNFLYVSLRAMKDIEGTARKFFEPLGLPFRDVVTPRQLYGIEKDTFAAKLAHVVVWIGYLQWRYEDEGILYFVTPHKIKHPRSLPHPVLQDKLDPSEPDKFVWDDAILRYDADGQPYEPEWPEVDYIVSNPPFLGGNHIRQELGAYVDDLFRLYDGRVPAFADLVTYWFEKARAQLETGKAKRVGMLATNSIRGGANRVVLERIKQTGDIFLAWPDNPWELPGAAVRISIVGFTAESIERRVWNGQVVEQINADLSSSVDITKAQTLPENRNICLRTNEKGGAFDISNELAQTMLAAKNKSERSNSDVLYPYLNGRDAVQRSRDFWIIDFGIDTPLEEAQQYEAPFAYVEQHVKPIREKNNVERLREQWWLHRVPGAEMRQTLSQLSRFIVTPAVAKHRLFIWLDSGIIPDHQLYAFAREDDYFFGVLHSYIHELWSLRMGTWLGKGNDPRYTPTTTFETFPLPWPPTQEDVNSAAYQRITEAAQALHTERDAWLNPSDLLSLGAGSDSKTLRERTLTNLYNALEAYRTRNNGENGNGNGKTNGNGNGLKDSATAFAPRLAELHQALDAAVLAAYGWEDLVESLRQPLGDEALLGRLLALNLTRVAGSNDGEFSA